VKPTTHIAMFAQNLGKPDESLRTDGPMQDVAKQLIHWLRDTTMAKGIRIEIGRNQEELGLKQARQDELDSMVDSIMAEVLPDAA
jgi:hypothetical protein